MKLTKSTSHKILATFLALTLVMSIACLSTVRAEASNSSNDTNYTDGPTRSTVYYPYSGLSSGHFTGLYSSVAKFHLPSGTFTINYCYNADGYSGTAIGTIQFSSSSETKQATLIGDGGANSTTITLSGGYYDVKIIASTGTANYTKYYGYDVVK